VFSFEIETPATQAQVAVRSDPGPPIGSLGEHRRILVTDDVPALREGPKEQLGDS
jgi:hypothetical protein